MSRKQNPRLLSPTLGKTWLLDSVRSFVLRKFRNLREAFLAIDRNRNGYITVEELRPQLLRWNLPLFSDEAALEVFCNSMDLRGDNKINYHDFVRVMRRPGGANESDEFLTSSSLMNAIAGSQLGSSSNLTFNIVVITQTRLLHLSA